MLRDGLKMVFRHFKIVGGQGIMLSNLWAVKQRYLAQYSNEDIVHEINRMEEDQLLIANEHGITLTDNGEVFIYGPFSIENGIAEFMQIFSHFHVKTNQVLLPANILAVKDRILSPQSNKHLSEIITELQNRGFISDGMNNTMALTEAGFYYLYR